MDTQEFLKSAILDLKDIDEAKLVPDLTLEDLDLDSLDYVELQLLIKKNYKVEMDPALFTSGEVKTLGNLSTYIEKNSATQLA